MTSISRLVELDHLLDIAPANDVDRRGPRLRDLDTPPVGARVDLMVTLPEGHELDRTKILVNGQAVVGRRA